VLLDFRPAAVSLRNETVNQMEDRPERMLGRSRVPEGVFAVHPGISMTTAACNSLVYRVPSNRSKATSSDGDEWARGAEHT
jgi:hypothetical protein